MVGHWSYFSVDRGNKRVIAMDARVVCVCRDVLEHVITMRSAMGLEYTRLHGRKSDKERERKKKKKALRLVKRE